MMNLLDTEDKPVIISSPWNMLWYNNLLFSKCVNHNTIITPNHIKNFHNITNPPNLSTILYEDHILHEKIKKK